MENESPFVNLKHSTTITSPPLALNYLHMLLQRAIHTFLGGSHNRELLDGDVSDLPAHDGRLPGLNYKVGKEDTDNFKSS